MAKNILRTGKKVRPKTAIKGKRYRCARCRKRSPKPVKTSAPWYCSNCLTQDKQCRTTADTECRVAVARRGDGIGVSTGAADGSQMGSIMVS